MTDRIHEIKSRLDKATPGPWNLRDWIEGDGGLRGIYVDSESGKWIHATECPANQDQHDADLIANCPTDLRACIAEIERLRDRVSELEARLICDLCGLCKTHHRLLPHQPIYLCRNANPAKQTNESSGGSARHDHILFLPRMYRILRSMFS